MKLHSFAFYALVAPAITLGAGSVLADSSADQNLDREQRSTQRGHDATQSNPRAAQGEQGARRAEQSHMKSQAQMQNRGYMAAAPAKGIQGSNLIGAEVKTNGGEEVGPVEDLIIAENGQIVAIVVGVGGFLGLGERDVAIGWDDVTKSITSDDELELRINATREGLSAAPEFKARD